MGEFLSCIGISEIIGKLDGCIFNALFRLTIKTSPKLSITGPLWGESTGDRWIPLTKGQWCRKLFHVLLSSWHIEPNETWQGVPPLVTGRPPWFIMMMGLLDPALILMNSVWRCTTRVLLETWVCWGWYELFCVVKKSIYFIFWLQS